ncbi:MAG TPA: nucleotidyltransferase family protein [Xanthobacteraceae bacterium]|jgi:hypothetical protein
MMAAQEDVFRLLCTLLASTNRRGREHAGSLPDPAIAAALVELAEEERVGPALHEALIACPAWQRQEAPRDLLARAWEQNLHRNLLIRSTLLSLAGAAARAGLEFVALKGCAWLVEEPTNAACWRSILDIDVLVEPPRFAEAPALMSQLGYHRISESSRFHENFHHAPYWKPDAPCTVEVHRHLGWRHQLLAPETIIATAKRAAPGLLQPAAWCRAFHAIVHWQVQDCGLSRQSVPLKEVLELARFMARPDVDWPMVVAHARAVGAMHECEAAVALAAELLGAPVPAEMKIAEHGKSHVRRALARRSSPFSTWLATEMWRAGTLWRCEKVAYRSFLRGARAARVTADVWIARAARLPLLAVRAVAIGVRGTALWIERHRRSPAVPARSAAWSEAGSERSVYEIYGLVIASELDLPELMPRRVASAAVPDVNIVFGRISPALIAAAGDLLLHAENGKILLTVPQVARYCVMQGNRVLVEPQAGIAAAMVRLFLLGSVIGLVCQQRGMLALHASAIAINGEAVAFVGRQGQGKSTLAAHCLGQNPARLVADDILVVSFDSDGQPRVQPGMPGLKLWRDALQVLGREAEGLRPDWIRAEKFILPILDQLAQAPARLNCVYVLDDDDHAGDGRIQELSGASAAGALVANTYRVEFLDLTGQRLAHFSASTRIAERVPVRRLWRCRDLMRVGATAAIVLADFAGRASSGELTLAPEARTQAGLAENAMRKQAPKQTLVTQ